MIGKLSSKGLWATAIAAGLGVASLATSANAAILTLEVRAVQDPADGGNGDGPTVTPSTANVVNPKSVTVGAVGQKVNLELIARITNADAGNVSDPNPDDPNDGNGTRGDEGFKLAHGALVSNESASAIRGDIAPMFYNTSARNDVDNETDYFPGGAVISPSTSDAGSPRATFDSNPDLELGGADPQDPTGWVIASSGTDIRTGNPALQNGAVAGTSESNQGGDTLFLLGRTTWTATGTGTFNSTTSINFTPRMFISSLDNGEIFQFRSEGVDYQVKVDDPNFNNLVASGSPVVITSLVPEPAGLGLLGLGAMAALRRRRSM